MAKALSWDDFDDQEELSEVSVPLASPNGTQSRPAAEISSPVVEPEIQRSPNGALPTEQPNGASVSSQMSQPVQPRKSTENAARDVALSEKARVTVDQKQMINCRADVNQLVPIKYDWAWQKYRDACANHWMPEEINMARDVALWKSDAGLTEDERRVVKRSLGFFSTADSLVANNLVLAIYRHITNPECRQYLLKQSFEEAVHTHAYQYCIESLDMNQSELFNMYREVPSVAEKAEWAIKYTHELNDPLFQTGTPETDADIAEESDCFLLCARRHLLLLRVHSGIGTRSR